MYVGQCETSTLIANIFTQRLDTSARFGCTYQTHGGGAVSQVPEDEGRLSSCGV